MDELENLLTCYTSGQMTEQQWEAHCRERPELRDMLAARRQGAGQEKAAPSDDQVIRLWVDHAPDTNAPTDGVIAFARALLARYGAQPAASAEPVGYLPAYELARVRAGLSGNLGSAKFEPSHLDGDVPVFLAPVAAQASGQAQDVEDAARWRTAVNNWRIKNVEVFDGVTLTHRSGIHWDDLIRQVDAARAAGGEQS